MEANWKMIVARVPFQVQPLMDKILLVGAGAAETPHVKRPYARLLM